MSFNFLVVVLFTATDYSLVATHCPDHKGCTPLELQAWNAAQVRQPASRLLLATCQPSLSSTAGPADGFGSSNLTRTALSPAQVLLVAVIDTAFWPLLRRIFYFVEDLWSGRSHTWMPEAAWMCIRRTLAALALLLLGFIGASAARHTDELTNVLHEFFSTYPAGAFAGLDPSGASPNSQRALRAQPLAHPDVAGLPPLRSPPHRDLQADEPVGAARRVRPQPAAAAFGGSRGGGRGAQRRVAKRNFRPVAGAGAVARAQPDAHRQLAAAPLEIRRDARPRARGAGRQARAAARRHALRQSAEGAENAWRGAQMEVRCRCRRRLSKASGMGNLPRHLRFVVIA